MTKSSSTTFLKIIGGLVFVGALVAISAVVALKGSQMGEPTPAGVAGMGSPLNIPEEPSQLSIPSIGVNAKVQQVGVTKTGAMGIPTNYTDVAWYKLGSRPGAPGTAVISGHLNGRNTPRAVFYDLAKLKDGDIVKVTDKSGKVLNFKVVNRKTYDYKASTEEVFAIDTKKFRLNLITCTGDWVAGDRTYDERVVIFTELVT